MHVLVTGGAGYIGSHVVRQLGGVGHDVTVLDNLSTGRREAVLAGELIVGDLADESFLERLFSNKRFDAVLHFAASILVPESVSDPIKYYRNNTRNTLGLLDLCARHGVGKFVFSSTAAVYGLPEGGRAKETSPLLPINPYGASKMMSERILMDLAAASDLSYVILRYFNVAGADPEGRIGQASPEATHLIKVACEAAVGKREEVTIYGTDYDTPDGTCIRDYIHVEDLASAHLKALEYLGEGNPSAVLNCGYGHGSSVREVLDVVKEVTGVDFPVAEGGRRTGDPPVLIAETASIRETLGWTPRFDNLKVIVETAYRWEKAFQKKK